MRFCHALIIYKFISRHFDVKIKMEHLVYFDYTGFIKNMETLPIICRQIVSRTKSDSLKHIMSARAAWFLSTICCQNTL